MGKKGRVFVRGMTSETYGLGEFRRQQLAVSGSATTASSSTTPRSATRATARSPAPGGGSAPATRTS